MNRSIRHITLSALCAICLPGYAQVDSVAHSVTMQDVEVTAHTYRSEMRTRTSGRIEWKMSQMAELPQILGNADPIHYAEMLPGIQTTGEYRSGVFIQGCDHSHSRLSLSGVPIYNVSHLLGFFSTFNASHFPTMELDKNPSSALSGNYLGGSLSMTSPTQRGDSLQAEMSLGLISSQGTLRLPIGKRTQMTVSGRGSYINLLYKHWLNGPDQSLNYSFYDANVTVATQCNEHNMLILDYYGGDDDGRMLQNEYTADMGALWGNQTAALRHQFRNEKWQWDNTLYMTSYHNNYRLQMEEMKMQLPSSIRDWGYRGELVRGGWSAGVEAIYHTIDPQRLKTENMSRKPSNLTWKRQTLESALAIDYSHPLTDALHLNVGLRGSLYGGEKTGMHYGIDPNCTLQYDNGSLQASAGYATRHQYLFQTGFSDLGLPSECWVSASREFKPQWAHILWSGASVYLWQRMFRLQADLFYRRLHHQMEYTGAITDMYATEYRLENNVTMGRGENYGFSVLLNKCAGAVTGWVDYTYTHARRTFQSPMHAGTYPANHERPHELDAVLNYAPTPHWSFGATWVYASGTPFTAPVSISVINGNLITRYGRHNANRLHAYSRLDLSANYKWMGRGGLQHGVNFSLYNATARANELFYYVSVHEDGSYAYKPLSFVVKVLPSLSYFIKIR